MQHWWCIISRDTDHQHLRQVSDQKLDVWDVVSNSFTSVSGVNVKGIDKMNNIITIDYPEQTPEATHAIIALLLQL